MDHLQNKVGKAKFQTSTVSASQKKIEVRGVALNVEKNGAGPHPVLCLPGALGSIESEFPKQLSGFDSGKFKVVAWDPPGYGRSRPPNRDVMSDPRLTLAYDGELAHELMKKLGFQKYSILGRYDGAITAMFMASSYPGSVRKIVLCDPKAYITKQDREEYIKIRNIDALPAEKKKQMIDMYGEEYLRKTWSDWMDAMIELYEKDGDICKKAIPKILCPTFIISETKNSEHSQFLERYIRNSRVLEMVHSKSNAQEFNNTVQTFLLEEDPRGEKVEALNSLME